MKGPELTYRPYPGVHAMDCRLEFMDRDIADINLKVVGIAPTEIRVLKKNRVISISLR